MIGAYILAGELARQPDYTKAFTQYEKLLRPFVTEVQKLPPGTPRLAHPKTRAGITVLHAVVRLISSRVIRSIGALFSKKNKLPTDDKIVLPKYESLVTALG